MTVYERALRKFSKVNQKKICTCLLNWQDEGTINGKIVPKNIQAEHFLSTDLLRDLLKVILENHDSEISELETKFVEKCRCMKLMGGRVRLSPMPKVLGHAVNRTVLQDRLFYMYKDDIFDEIDEVRDFIDSLLCGQPLANDEKKMFMSKHIVWAVWDKKDVYNPFIFLQTDDPDEAMASLGLDLRKKGDSILLLNYNRTPYRVIIYRATVADAELYSPFDPPILEAVSFDLFPFIKVSPFSLKLVGFKFIS